MRPVLSPCDGYIAHIACDEMGTASLLLGGGRQTKESEIDLSVGLVLQAKVGDYVHAGEPLAILHANDESKEREARKRFLDAYHFSREPVDKPKLIKRIMM